MAKSKIEKEWYEEVEAAVRLAINSIPGLNAIPERDYCAAVAEGLDLVLSGVTARQEELEGDDE